jgi:hypothetical protein
MSVDQRTGRAAAHGGADFSCCISRVASWLLIACLFLAALSPAMSARADQEACLAAHERAQLERMHARYLEARQQLLLCAQAECPAVVRADCKGWLQEVESSLPSVVFAPADERGRDLLEARVSSEAGLLSERMDGRAIAIDPGVHKLRVEAPGFAPAELELSVREGEKRRLVRVVLHPSQAGLRDPADAAQLEQTKSARRARWLMLSGYVLGGLGVASLATGVAIGTIGKRKLDALHEQACEPLCDEAEVDAGQDKYEAANVAFGVGAGLLGAGLFTWLWGFRKQRALDHAPKTLSLALGHHKMFLAWEGRF